MKVNTQPATFLMDVQHSPLTLVAITAPEWCPPCSKMEPILTEIADEYPAINILTMNPDISEDFCRFLNVQTVPTFIVFKDGDEVNRFIGYQPKGEVLAQLVAQ